VSTSTDRHQVRVADPVLYYDDCSKGEVQQPILVTALIMILDPLHRHWGLWWR
jgi:hypothetical protein